MSKLYQPNTHPTRSPTHHSHRTLRSRHRALQLGRGTPGLHSKDRHVHRDHSTHHVRDIEHHVSRRVSIWLARPITKVPCGICDCERWGTIHRHSQSLQHIIQFRKDHIDHNNDTRVLDHINLAEHSDHFWLRRNGEHNIDDPVAELEL